MSFIHKKNIKDILPLNAVQEGILFNYLNSNSKDDYFEQLSIDLTGSINHEIFNKAWNYVILNNSSLISS